MKEMRLKKFRRNMILKDGSALMPKRAVFYPTLRCNLHCKMCFQNSHDRNCRELSLEQIKELFDSIKLDSIHLVGGEIFIRKDIYEMLQYFNTVIKHISLQTNATMISEEGSKIINSLTNIKEIWISVDGMMATHDSIRGRGSYSKIMSVINSLRHTKRIVINTVIMEENIDELIDMYEYFNKLDVYKVVFQFQMQYSQENMEKTQQKLQSIGIQGGMYDDCVRDEIDMKYINGLESIILELRKIVKQTEVEFFPGIFETNISAYMKGNIFENREVFCRDIIDSVLKISPEGRMIICEALNCEFDELRIVSLEKQWNSENVRGLRKKLISNNLVDLCSRCCCLDVME